MPIVNSTNQTTALQQAFLTVEEAVERYKIPKSVFSKWRKNGDGPPYIQLEKRVIYPIKDVDKWFQKKIKT